MKLKLGTAVHEIARRSESEFEVDGVRVTVSLTSDGASGFRAKAGGRTASMFVARQGERVYAQVGERAYVFTVVNRSSPVSSVDAGALGGLEAPMPGRVTRVAVGAGDLVKRGQELIVIEAMKMENAIVAPSDGVVRSLSVKEGDMVAPGSALVVVEPL